AEQHLSTLGSVQRLNKADGSFVTEIDQKLQTEIALALKAQWPQVRLLGEEMTREQQNALLEPSINGSSSDEPLQQQIWVLDPLDGTTNFSTGLPLFGVSLALVVDGQSQLAVVYDPTRKESFTAQRGKGAHLNGQALQSSSIDNLADCVANVDYKRLTHELAQQLVSCPPYRSQRNLGTCVLEWCWLAADRLQLYLHGGQQLWDHAAGHLILEEAGGMARSLQGAKMNARSLCKQSTVAAASPHLFELWQDWISLQLRH
ncbi:MAG: inositol monophosphatase family protein, partial [Methylococcales bacterium]|nr:inositol monophosphatase family protein [Methylococcales bacterium]